MGSVSLSNLTKNLHVSGYRIVLWYIMINYHMQEKSRYENDIHVLRLEIECLKQTEKEKLQKLKEEMKKENEEAERKNQKRINDMEKEKVHIYF